MSNNDATCTADGTKTATCDNGCGTTDTIADEGSATGHAWGDWQQIEGDNVNHKRICGTCQAEETAEHEFDVQNTPATCTEAGSITYTCSDCGYTYTVDGDPATGHDWGTWEYLDEDNHERFCSKNDGGHEIEAHDWVEDTTLYIEPDEETEGQIVYTCSKCGEQKVVKLPKHVHTFGEWTKAEGDAEFHYRSCEQCDKVESQAHTFDTNVTNATCTVNGKTVYTCSVCGFSYEEVITAPGHSFTKYVSNNDATCTADGTKTATCDNGCGETDTIADEGSALGHSFTNYVSNNDATCTADGTKTAKCDRCDVTDTIADEGSAKGHSFTNYVSNNDATCTADGTKTAKCDRCDVTDTIADANTKLGHEFGAWTDNGENHKRECVRGDAEETAAHTYGDWTVTKPATATEEGEKERVCTECGHKETETIDKTEPEVLTLSAPGVDPANKIVVTVPYSRRGLEAVQLTASEDGVTYTTSKPKLLTVDENGKVTFVRLCVFCRSAVITATTPDGRTAQAEVKIKLRWYHYILFILFGCLWY